MRCWIRDFSDQSGWRCERKNDKSMKQKVKAGLLMAGMLVASVGVSEAASVSLEEDAAAGS